MDRKSFYKLLMELRKYGVDKKDRKEISKVLKSIKFDRLELYLVDVNSLYVIEKSWCRKTDDKYIQNVLNFVLATNGSCKVIKEYIFKEFFFRRIVEIKNFRYIILFDKVSNECNYKISQLKVICKVI